MAERAYTLSDIERMRQAVRSLVIRPMVSYSRVEKNAEVEDHLRTYMAAGIAPDELESRVDADIAAQQKLYFQQKD